MSKYRNLSSHLASLTAETWTARFREIEKILGFALPKSAYSYPAWWSNQAGPGHSQTAGWKAAGWRTGDLDLASQQVTFSRDLPRREPAVRRIDVAREDHKGLTIAEARAGLAAYFGVPPESVEITIKG
jgi:hypothetical protein